MDPKINARVKDGWKPRTAEAGAEEIEKPPPVPVPPARKSADSEPEARRKVGFLISDTRDFKLTIYARKHRKSRSEVIEECLDEKLRGVVVSFRGKSSEAETAA